MRPFTYLPLRDSMELIEAAEYAEVISYQSKQHAFFILCLTAAFVDTQERNIQELQYLLADYLEEDHNKIQGFYVEGKVIASYLTDKQLNIVSLLFKGNSQLEIAQQLNLHKSTVSHQLIAIRKKISKYTSMDWGL